MPARPSPGKSWAALAILALASFAAILLVGGPVGGRDRITVKADGGVSRHAATFEDAIGVAAEMRRGDRRREIVITLPPGTQRLREAVVIRRDASGPGDGLLTIRSATPRAAVISGGVRLGEPLQQVPEDLQDRLPQVARDHVRAYRLPASAADPNRIQTPRPLRRRDARVAFEVFDERGPLRPARWPNDGWARTDGGAGPVFATGEGPLRLERWSREEDLWAEGYWRWGWLFESFPVAGVIADLGRIELEEPPFEGFVDKARFRMAHALSELDEAGEWWRDRRRGLLLVWPRGRADALEVSVADNLIEMDGAAHVRLDGLVLEMARGDLVTVRDGEDVVVRSSVLRRAGGKGISIARSETSGLERSDVLETGAGGVALSGGNRARLAPGRLFMRNCRLTDYARLARTQTPAIAVDGVGQEISRNYFHDTDAYAVHLRGNEHRLVWNEFTRLLADSTDSGAIYAGRDWTARGSLIAHNFLHDIRAAPGSEVKGVYLDDMASGFNVRDNLFFQVDQPVFIGGGRDNNASGNAFVRSAPAVHIDSRGLTWALDAVINPLSELRAAFAAMPVDNAVWRARYPELSGILLDDPGRAKGNRIVDNLIVEGEALRFADLARPEDQRIAANRGPDGLDSVRRAGRLVKVVDRTGARIATPEIFEMARRPLKIWATR